MAEESIFQHIRLPRNIFGRNLSKNRGNGHGLKLFFKDGKAPSLVGIMQVSIISCINSFDSPRKKEIEKTIANYLGKTQDGKSHWDIFILVPRELAKFYDFLPNSVHLVLYETYETNLKPTHRLWRNRNVGDARNATLALGCILRVKRLLVSDDDRSYCNPNFNCIKKNKNRYYWVNSDKKEITSVERFNQWKTHCDSMFSANSKLAVLGFSSYNRRRSWKSKQKTDVPMYFSSGKQHCAQLFMLNIELLKKQSITYLPIRMGEDTAFQYQLMKAGYFCMESSHLSHNSLPSTSCPSIARSPKNAQLDNYSSRDKFWWKKFMETGCVDKNPKILAARYYWHVYWCPNSPYEKAPNFIGASFRKTMQEKADKLKEKWEKWVSNEKKGKIPDDPRLICDDDPEADNFDYKEVCKRVLEDESAGWQILGELLTQMRKVKII